MPSESVANLPLPAAIDCQTSQQTAQPVEITVFEKPGPLTKRISLGADGKPRSDGSECVMVRGTAKRARVADVAGMAEVIANLSSSEAIALGALRDDLPDEIQITTKRRQADNQDAVARTGENIGYRPGKPAYALIDYDQKGMPREVSERIAQAGGFWPALLKVVPELANATRIMRRSTSAGITNSETGETYPSSGGLHVYLLVKDGADIDRFLRCLHDRCWLAGFGWLMVGAGGQLLERSIVDRMVGAPERLVFEGAPVLEPPLTQDASRRRPVVRDGVALDTVAVCPPLTIVETARLKDFKAREAARLKPESARARQAFIDHQTERLAGRNNMTREQAAAVVARQCEGVLRPSVVLPFDDPELAGTTVGDVLADPARFEGETLADPLEGVEYGRCKAKVLHRADGSPWIHSFAHGRTIYELKHDASAVERAAQEAPPEQAVDAFVEAAINADLRDDETARLVDLVAQKARVGKRAVTARLKAARDQQERQRAEERRAHQVAERDPRPQIPAPAHDAEWLPVMQTLNEVLGAVETPEPPMRDVEGYMVRVETKSLPGLRSANTGAEEERLPAPEQPVIVRLERAQLDELIEQHIRFVATDKHGNERPVHLGAGFVEHYLRRSDKVLPVVHSVATMPMVMPNGELLAGHGLDRERGVVFRIPRELQQILPQPEDCTLDAAQEAMRFLCDEWLVDVATGYTGKAIIVAATLTILERLLLPERPAFIISAGQRGGGKTTTANMIAMATTGVRASLAQWSPNDEERRKALLTYFSAGLPIINWDNIPKGALISCPHLERALTADTFTDRVLGETEHRTAPATTVHIFTGNNIMAKGDLASRSLMVRLDVDRPDPENRPFTHEDPLGWTEVSRGRILRSLYTIMLANPRLRAEQRSPAETRFKLWWHLVGSAVENAAAEPVRFRDLFIENEADDEQANALAYALDVIRKRWGIGVTANQVAKFVGQADDEAQELKGALETASARIIRAFTSMTLTRLLQSLKDAPVELNGEVVALRYTPSHEGGVYTVRPVRRA